MTFPLCSLGFFISQNGINNHICLLVLVRLREGETDKGTFVGTRDSSSHTHKTCYPPAISPSLSAVIEMWPSLRPSSLILSRDREGERTSPQEILEKAKMSPRMSWLLICTIDEKNPLKLRGRGFFKNAIFMTNKDHPAQTAPDNWIRRLPVLCQWQPQAPEVCAVLCLNPFIARELLI